MFITKMPVIRIINLAQVMIEELAPLFGQDPATIGIEIIGSKPGEKLYEELMSHEEASRTIELTRYFAVLPAFRGFYKSVKYEYEDIVTEKVGCPYVSSEVSPLSPDELRSFLLDNRLLETTEQDEIDQRYWPGDKEEQTQ